MKIVHVIPFFAPAWGYGGPVRVSYELAKCSAKAGHQVSVLTTDAYDHTRRIDQVCEEIDKVKIFRARNLSNKLAKDYNLFLPKGFSKLCQTNIKNADIVHLHSFYHFLNVIAARHCRKYKVPYLVHLHELPVAEPLFGKVAIKKFFNKLWGITILTGAKKIICLTEQEKELTIKAYPFLKSKIEILPNPLDPPKLLIKSTTDLIKKYGYGKDDKILLSLSRLSDLKRIDRIIEGLAELAKTDPYYKLIVAGPDEMGNLAKLKQLACKLSVADQIKFTGAVVGQEKEDLFLLADLYVLLADYESFSITTLEAISYGKPVLLSPNVGIASELKPYNACAITQVNSPQDIAKAIEQAIKKKPITEKKRNNILQSFELKQIYKRLEKIYAALK